MWAAFWRLVSWWRHIRDRRSREGQASWGPRRRWLLSVLCSRPSPLQPDQLPCLYIDLVGSESIFNFRKSGPSEAEAQCLRLCRQPQEKRGGSWPEWGCTGSWGTKPCSWPGREIRGWGGRERKRPGRFAVSASLSCRVSAFANSNLLGKKLIQRQ